MYCQINSKQYKKVTLFKYGNLTNESYKITNNDDDYKDNIKLKNHQKTTLYYMEKLENSQNNKPIFYNEGYFNNLQSKIGVLADQAGSGKNICILYRIFVKPYLNTVNISSTKQIINCDYNCDYNGYNDYLLKISNNKYKITNIINTNLIVVPTNKIKKWISQIKQFNFTHIVIKNENDLKTNLKEYNGITITLLNSKCFTKFYEKYNIIKNKQNYIFSRIIFDIINIRNCQKINSIFYWFLTNSSENLLFPLGKYQDQVLKFNETTNEYYKVWEEKKCRGIVESGFIKNVFYNLCICDFNIYNTIFLKNTNNYIQESLQLTIKKHYIECERNTTENIMVSFSKLSSFLNKDDYQSIANHLQIDIEQESNIVKAICKNIDSQIYNEQQKQNCNDDKIKIFQEKLEDIKQKIMNANQELCCICYDNLQKPIAITKCCNHFFCFRCLIKSFCTQCKLSCPYCRGLLIDLNKNEKNKENEENEENEENKFYILHNEIQQTIYPKKTKYNQLLSLILSKTSKIKDNIILNCKILIYIDQNYEKLFLQKISDNLKHKNILIHFLTKNINKNKKILNLQKKETNNVIIVNQNIYENNLTQFTDLIICHKIEKHVEHNLIGTIKQFSNKKKSKTPLNIYYLYYQST